MKNKLGIGIVILAFILSMGVVVYAKAQAKPEGTINIAFTEMGYQVMDPLIGGPNSIKIFLCPMYDWLIGTDDDGRYSPDRSVAYKWKYNPDRMTWTFWIRKGIKFHNGDPLTAEDVKFSFDRAMSDYSRSTMKKQLRRWIKNVELASPDKIVLHCREKLPLLLYELSDQKSVEPIIVPKKYIEEKGNDYFARHPIGSGPYRFSEQVIGSYIKYEAMPTEHWWAGMPRYKYVYCHLVTEAAVRLAKLKTGEVDVTPINREQLSGVKAAEFKVFRKPGLNVGLFYPMTWKPENPLSKLKVRKALALAIDKKELIKYVFGGDGVSTGAWPITKGSPGWIDLPPYPYNPDEAKRLLSEAGYPNGFELDVWSYAHKLYPDGPLFMEAVASYYDKIGIKTRIVKSDYPGFRAKCIDDTFPHLANVAHQLSGVRGDYVSYYNFMWRSNGKLHCCKIPEVDALLDAAEMSQSKEQYLERMEKLVRDLYGRALYNQIANTVQLYGAHPKIGDWWTFTVAAYDMGLNNLLMRR